MIPRPLTLAVSLLLLHMPMSRADESWVGLKVMNTKPKVQEKEKGEKGVRLGFSWCKRP